MAGVGSGFAEIGRRRRRLSRRGQRGENTFAAGARDISARLLLQRHRLLEIVERASDVAAFFADFATRQIATEIFWIKPDRLLGVGERARNVAFGEISARPVAAGERRNVGLRRMASL